MLDGFIFDLDGTLYNLADSAGPQALPGAVDLVDTLRREGIPHCFVTNTTSKTAATMAADMRQLGFTVDTAHLLTPVVAARAYLHSRGYTRVAVEYCPALHAELADFELSNTPQAVIMADDSRGLDYDAVNRIIAYARAGAEIITLQKNRLYQKDGALIADLGFYWAGMEYVLGQPIPNFGKPSPLLFEQAMHILGLTNPSRVGMVGDDVEFDVLGAMQYGLTGILVKTGKYRPGAEDKFDIAPHYALSGIEEILTRQIWKK